MDNMEGTTWRLLHFLGECRWGSHPSSGAYSSHSTHCSPQALLPIGVIWHLKIASFWCNKELRQVPDHPSSVQCPVSSKFLPGGVVITKKGEVNYYYRDKAGKQASTLNITEIHRPDVPRLLSTRKLSNDLFTLARGTMCCLG